MTAGLRARPRDRVPPVDPADWPPRPPRRTGWAWLAVGLWAAVATALVVGAYADGRAGERAIARARGALAEAGPEDERIGDSLREARAAFDRAHRRSSSPLLVPLRAVPVLGRQLGSYAALTSAGSRLAEIGMATTEGAQRALAGPAATGPERVALLHSLSRLAKRADGELARVQVPRTAGLAGPLADRWASLGQEVRTARARVDGAGHLLDAVAAALGGPRRYLLLVANNAEMRAGSGMFLSVGTIDAVDGRVRLGPTRASGELALPGAGAELDGDLAERWGWLQPGREWRNLATTPRFDVTGPLAARMWERLTGERVDGVLAVDAELLRAVLTATGPVVVGTDTYTSENVVQYILHDQYAGMAVHDAQHARRDQLADIADGALGAVEAGRTSLRTLAQRVAAASRGRHLLAWSSHPPEQEAWEAAGIAGVLESTSLAVSVLNRGGNKLDHFLAVEAAIETQARGGATDVALRVTARNATPAGEPGYVAGPHPHSGIREGDYLGIVAVNVPAAATGLGVDGSPRPVSAGRDGPTQVVAVPLLVPPGEEATVTVRFRLPGEHGEVVVHPSARLPPVTWRMGDEHWVDDSTRRVGW